MDMKKIYSKPETDVVKIDAPQVLTMSSQQYPGPFGQVPDMDDIDDSIHMA